MSICVLNKFNKNKLYTYPFPHVLIEDSLSDRVYKELERTLLLSKIKQLGQRRTFDWECRYEFSEFKYKDWALGSFWEDFMDYHTSPEFVDKVLNIFSNNLKNVNFDFCDTDNVYLRNHQPHNLNRHEKARALAADCQVVVHEALGEHSTTRTAHVDSFKEIYAGLLYMKKKSDKSIGGDLELYTNNKRKTKFLQNTHREVDLNHISKAKIIPYRKNTFVLFLNTPSSVHGVSPRINARKERVSVNIIAERIKSKFFTI
jgi:hypothetical protein